MFQAQRRDPGLTRATLLARPRLPLEDSVNPFEDPVNSLHYPCEFSWESDLTLSASLVRGVSLSASVLTWSGTSRFFLGRDTRASQIRCSCPYGPRYLTVVGEPFFFIFVCVKKNCRRVFLRMAQGSQRRGRM